MRSIIQSINKQTSEVPLKTGQLECPVLRGTSDVCLLMLCIILLIVLIKTHVLQEERIRTGD